MLSIEKIDTSKHAIRQRKLMELQVIPNHPGITIFSGAQGSGKSNLVANMIMKEAMYGKSYELMEEELQKAAGKSRQAQPKKKGYFDAIFLFVGSLDDMLEHCIDLGLIKQNHVCESPMPEDIQKVIDGQKSAIERADGDMTLVPKVLCLFDDVANDGRLLRSKPFLELFVKGRHLNSSTWFLTQYLNLVPRPCRIQANWTFVFKVNRAEMEILCDQYCPSNATKKEFSKMVYEATQDDEKSSHNFFVICKRAPEDKKFRKNLDMFINLKRMKYNPKLDLPKKKRKPRASHGVSKKELEDREFDIEGTVKTLKNEGVQRRVLAPPHAGNVLMSKIDEMAFRSLNDSASRNSLTGTAVAVVAQPKARVAGAHKKKIKSNIRGANKY